MSAWTSASVIVRFAPSLTWNIDATVLGMRSLSAKRRELDKPDAVLVPVEQIGAHLQGEARLADAARADERDEPVLGEQLR